MKISKSHINTLIDFAAIITCVGIFIIGSLININRFWQFELGYYDLGMFDRPIWEIAHFRPPIIDHFVVGGKINLADHFNPGIYLLSPIYWLTSKTEALLILPSLAVGVSGYVIYNIGKKLYLSRMLSFGVLFMYFFFLGTQNAIYSDFHALTIASLTIALTYYFIITNSKRFFISSLLLTLSLKESLFIFGFSIGIFIYIYKKWRKLGLSIVILSIIWGILIVKIIMPGIAGQVYTYPISLPLNPILLIKELTTPILKLKTISLSFISFLFLPLGSASLLPHIFLNFASRFLTIGAIRWDLGLHYNAEIAPTLAIASLLTLQKFRKYITVKIGYIVGIIMIIFSVSLNIFYINGPYILGVHPAFYRHTNNFHFLTDLVSQVPKESTVATQNNLASHFLHHKNVWILREGYEKNNPDYIVIDLREGQNPNNHLGIKNLDELFTHITLNPEYKVVYNQGEQYIFKRVQ